MTPITKMDLQENISDKAGISIVIPTCDRPQTLMKTLTSLMLQTRAPDEVIVVDNGHVTSCISSAEYPFDLRYFRIPVRAGVSQARNFGISMARCDFITLLDDDDFWENNYLEVLAKLIDKNKASADMFVARVDHLKQGIRSFFRFAGQSPSASSIFYYNPGYLGSAISVKKTAFIDIGGFDPEFKTGEDKELALRFLLSGLNIVYSDKLIAINCVHADSLSAQIDYIGNARRLIHKYRGCLTLYVYLKTVREAMKKSRKMRYKPIILLLKLILAFCPKKSVRYPVTPHP